MILQLVHSFERRFRPFSEDEAWLLFRLAAFGEAVGWTLLIGGIGVQRFIMHGNTAPVLIAGQTHGTFFILYIVASVLCYPSLGWRFRKAFIAGLASVPPYGSLIFEQIASRQRQQQHWHQQKTLHTYRLLLATS